MKRSKRDTKLEGILNTANAEFWLWANNGLAEMFGESVRAYIDGLTPKEARGVIASYKQWAENHPEAVPHN